MCAKVSQICYTEVKGDKLKNGNHIMSIGHVKSTGFVTFRHSDLVFLDNV